MPPLRIQNSLHLLIYFVWKQFIKNNKKKNVNQKNKIEEKKLFLLPCSQKKLLQSSQIEKNWTLDQLQNITKKPNTIEMVFLPPEQYP